MIRVATPADAAAILDIYAPYIRDTSLTFETEVPSEKEFARRILTYLQEWPWLVYEAEDGRIAGYAYASRYRERKGYQWSVECSVYIHNDFFKQGTGRRLYQKLFALLQAQGYATVYAVINLPNDRSVAFHEKTGFTYFATYEKVGYKLGCWKDVGWWRLPLSDYPDDPPAPVPFSQLSPEVINNTLKQ
ncbi:MAG TPA: N-acetyltransferase family protein [Chitinophagaceae bacterium]|nr:N-acetyltransferase family protein [Chitinophagaceae bacterium]